ncbi:rhomboid family intramembrane serine protease [Aureivirga marina]|uniref:rhomboid family intramembrane serine protease n=1 Tax=Aureivirga marina TaxID=1182451 RepID=UPI0018CB11F7|nr:rhomboid family intramembrane serine protease [Aureivirga marina]
MSIYKELKSTAFTSLKLVAIIWVVYILDVILSGIFNYPLTQFGIYPRSIRGLMGIFAAPFLHGGLYHIVSNTLPLFFLFTIFLTIYKKNAIKIIPIAIIFVGLITWIIGRKAMHIGASGFIYFLASFLFFAGIFEKKMIAILTSILVFIFYGGMFWGIFPSHPYISWEGHLAGFISGIILAFMFKPKNELPDNEYHNVKF